MLLPGNGTQLRSAIDQWRNKYHIHPKIVAEFDDSALMKAFGEAGVGVFAGPSAIEKEVCAMYRSSVIGRTEGVTEQFYAISPERRLKHPAVVLITETARADLFLNGTQGS